MVLVILLYMFLASTFVLAKNALAYASPCFLIGFRSVIAGILLLGYLFLRNKKQLSIKKEDLLLFFKVAIVHIYLAFLFDFWSLQYVSALKSTLLFSTTPFVAAALAYFLLHERLKKGQVLGILLGLLGMIPVLMAGRDSEFGFASLFSISFPEVVLMGAVVCGAYAWFMVKRLMDKGYSLSLINGFAMLVGGIMHLVSSMLFENIAHPVIAWGPFLGWTTLLILVSNIIFYNLYGLLLKKFSITFLTFAGFLCPGFGALYAWLWGTSVLSWHYIVSIALVTAGLYLYSY